MKRILSLVLAFVLVLTMLPMPAARAAAGGKLVALTFDDGPSSRYTEQLLDGLKERNVPVTFFMLGSCAEDNPDIVRRAYEEGHEIACHTWDHPDLTGLSDSEIREQMSRTFEELDKACGEGADYLVRPPYGSTNARVRAAIDNPLLYWSVDSRDWELLNTQKVRNRILEDTYDGAIILCHDIHKTTIPAALQAIDELKALGYEFVTVSELYRRRGVEMQDGVLHYHCKPKGVDYGPIPAPVISCTASKYGTITVTMTCDDGDAPIYYTLDGSYPNEEAECYTGPFTVDYFTEITAVAAYKLNGSRSALGYLEPSDYPCLTPEVGLKDGELVLTTATPGARIYYTLDGSTPTAEDIRYNGAVQIPGDSYVRAVAIHTDAGKSPVSGMYYFSEEGELYADMNPGNWFYEAVDQMHRMGILNGTGAYTMAPDMELSRGMLVTLLHRYSGETLENQDVTHHFADVEDDTYYTQAVEWAYRNGIVDGYSDTAFGPDDPVDRQQMCKIVADFLRHLDKPLRPGESCEAKFADYADVASWALDSVNAMVSAGLILGDGVNLNPQDGASRAEFCVLLCRVMDYVESYVPPVEQVEIVESDGELLDGMTVYQGDSLWFVMGTLPLDAADGILVTSSNPDVVSVTMETGWNSDETLTQILLEYKAEGTADITISSADGTVSETYRIYVMKDDAVTPTEEMTTEA